MSHTDALNAKLWEWLMGESPPPETHLSLIRGGLGYLERDLAFLADGQNPRPINMRAAKNFADIVNSSPKSSGEWRKDASNFVKYFRDNWLQNVRVPPVKLSEADSAELEKAREYVKANRKTFVDYRSRLSSIQSQLNELTFNNQRPADYDVKLEELRLKRREIEEDWDMFGDRKLFETMAAKITYYTSLGYEKLVDDLRKDYDALTVGPVGSEFLPATLHVSSLDEGLWGKFSFNSESLENYKQRDSSSWGGSASAGGLFWSAKIEHNEEHSEYLEDNKVEKFSVEMEICRTAIIRDGFDASLLTSRSWYWPRAWKEDPIGGDVLSNGNRGSNNNGIWQSIPTEAIWARNLKVKLNTGETHIKEKLDKVQNSVKGGFWCFGGSYHGSSEEHKRTLEIKVSADGVEFKGLHLIGFVCQLMPKEPNPVPNILPLLPPQSAMLAFGELPNYVQSAAIPYLRWI